MTDNLTCQVCGGKDFINEAGFYYCNECQTQTQELQEQHYDLDETAPNTRLKSTTITKSKTSSEANVRITTWEGYNFIMAGLVKELIELGASSELKEVTYQLWVAYLMELEILSNKTNATPKLGATFRKKDAEIVYQHQQKRRVRKSQKTSSYAPSTITDSTDMRQYYREKAKQKRLLVRAEYETFTTNTQSSDTSLINKTLSNVGSSDEEADVEKRVRYNKAARKELTKHMSTSHLRKHVFDVEGNLKCHDLKSSLTSTYKSSPYIITRNKLYSLIYIGLLLTEESIQLGDLLRFCREGHLSYLSYNHFFPENFSENQIDAKLYQDGPKVIPTHENIREMTFKIQKMLKFQSCNFCPNLKKLCERYCTELNLPDEIKHMAINLINQTQPKFKNIGHRHFPNYEGRAIAYILYVLKLLFGLDGVTEFKISTFADQLNKTQQFCGMNKMFVFSDWIKFIEYRKVVLKTQHFPTSFALEHNSINSCNLFVNFLQKQRSEDDVSDKQNLSMDIVQKLLNDLEVLQNGRHGMYLDFEFTFTPMHDYTKTLLKKQDLLVNGFPIQNGILESLNETKLDYIFNSKPHLKELNGKNYMIIDKGANDRNIYTQMNSNNYDHTINLANHEKDWLESFSQSKLDEFSLDELSHSLLKYELKKMNQPIEIEPVEVESKHKELNKDLILKMNNKNNKDKVGRDKKGRFCKVTSPQKVTSTEYATPRKRGKWFISSWTDNPALDEKHFSPLYPVMKGKSIEEIMESRTEHKNRRKRKLEADPAIKYNVHFQPHLEYWINVADMKTINKFKWKELYSSLPTTFQWLLAELARTVEQTPKELYTEFVAVELYINYVYLKNSPTHTYTGVSNSLELTKLISKIVREW